MAFVGMMHPVVAKMSAYTPGTTPTYQAGMVMGKAITGNLTITRNNNPLYGDDGVAEDDNSITAMSLELGLTDLEESVQEYMGLLEADGETAGHYIETGDSSPELGVGYIRVRRLNGVTSYQGIWIFRGVFGPTNENSQTKQESIQWQTPTVTGNAMRTLLTGSKNAFRRKANFETYAAAETWLNGQANIGSLTAITVASAAGSTSGKTALTISGYTLPTGASYVYKSAASDAPAITFGQVPDYTWTPWDGSAQLAITNGHKVTVAAVGENGKAIASGSATVVSA